MRRRNPVAQRQLPETGVARLVAQHCPVVRIDEDAAKFAIIGQGLVGEQHAGRLISLRGGPHLCHVELRVDGLRGLDLFSQRHL